MKMWRFVPKPQPSFYQLGTIPKTQFPHCSVAVTYEINESDAKQTKKTSELKVAETDIAQPWLFMCKAQGPHKVKLKWSASGM